MVQKYQFLKTLRYLFLYTRFSTIPVSIQILKLSIQRGSAKMQLLRDTLWVTCHSATDQGIASVISNNIVKTSQITEKKVKTCWWFELKYSILILGERFAVYQTRMGLIKMLKDFRVDVCEKTIMPYENDPKTMALNPKGGIFLKISKLTN